MNQATLSYASNLTHPEPSTKLSNIDHKLMLVAPALHYRHPDEWAATAQTSNYHRSLEPFVFGIADAVDRQKWNALSYKLQGEVNSTANLIVLGTLDRISRKEDLNPILLKGVLTEKPVPHRFVGLNQMEFQELIEWLRGNDRPSTQ